MAETGPKLVTLIAPDGSGEVNVSHPASITNLVYGSGYKVKGGKSPDEAAAWLVEKNDIADPAPVVEAPKVEAKKS